MSSFIKFTLVCFIPIFSLLYLKRKQLRLEDDHYKIRYGTLYRNVKTTNPTALYTNFVFCLRRFMLTFATIFFGNWLFLQIIVFTYTTLFQLCFFIAVRPMTQPLLNRIEIINELFTLGSVYFLLYFTDWCDNPEVRNFAGLVYMMFLIVIVIINFLMIAYEMIS